MYMYKVAVVGEKDSVLPFKALGMDVYPVLDENESRNTIDSLAGKGYAVIFLTEGMAAKIPETVERYDNKVLPAIILIPGNYGTLNIGLERINRNVEKAVGVNILQEGR